MKKILVILFAALFLLVPAAEWVISVSGDPFFSGGGSIQPRMFLLYYPARIFALAGFVLIMFQFLLTSRLRFFEDFGRAELIKRHKSLGKVGFALVVLHGAMMLASDIAEYGALTFNMEKYLGLVAVFLFVPSAAAALWFSELKFDLKIWKGFHMGVYIVFPLAFFHAINLGGTAGSGTTRIIFSLFLVVYGALTARKIVSFVSRRKPSRDPKNGDLEK